MVSPNSISIMHRLGVWVLLSLSITVSGEDCVWVKTADFPEFTPLMLNSRMELIYPVVEGDQTVIRVPSGTKMTIACPGRAVGTVKGELEIVEAKCVSNTTLFVNGQSYTLKRLGCTGRLKSTISRGLGECGEGRGELMAIGYKVCVAFFEVVRVCFDTGNQTTLYAEHVIRGAHINAKDINPSRPSFKTSRGFFSVSMSKIYKKASQRSLLTTLLGSEDLASTLIYGNKYYLAKGHMSPDADFVTEAEQDATYYYINALPQWQTFNNGNWKSLEYDVRSLAETLSRDLRVYSGGYGVLHLPDINNNSVAIYLGLTEQETVVPVPEVTWKVVYDEFTDCAAAIVGVNNPHLDTPPNPICNGSCSGLEWLDFDMTDLEDGFTYCCTVADLRKAVPYVPDLGSVCFLNFTLPETKISDFMPMGPYFSPPDSSFATVDQ